MHRRYVCALPRPDASNGAGKAKSGVGAACLCFSKDSGDHSSYGRTLSGSALCLRGSTDHPWNFMPWY